MTYYGGKTMERQYTRLDKVRDLLDAIIKSIPNEEIKRSCYVHHYGVGLMASLIAFKRGYSRETAELAGIAGMLHDLLTYVDPEEDTLDHAHKCADYAKEKVLDRLDCFTDEEKALICKGICNHSDKSIMGTPFDEIVKDADQIQHMLRNPMEDRFYIMPRTQKVLEELTK